MAQITEHVCHINDADGGSFDGSWTYDDQSGDLVSATYANTTPHAYDVRVQQGSRVNTFTIAAGASGTQSVPNKRYGFVQAASPSGEMEWAPNFTFSAFRA